MPRSTKNPDSFAEPIPTIVDLMVKAYDRALTTLHIPCPTTSRAHYFRNSLYAYRKALRAATRPTPHTTIDPLQASYQKRLLALDIMELSILCPPALHPLATHATIKRTDLPIPNCTPDRPLALQITFRGHPDSKSYSDVQLISSLASLLPAEEDYEAASTPPSEARPSASAELIERFLPTSKDIPADANAPTPTLPDLYNTPQDVRTTDDEPTYEEQ